MATDLERTARQTTDDAIENTVMGADLVTGAAVTVADNIARVVNHPVREAHKIERRGAQANRQIGRDIDDLVEDAGEVAEAFMPERVALAGIGLIKRRARSSDVIGVVAYQWLRMVNSGLTSIQGTINRFERATEPPARHSSERTRRTTRPVRKAAAATRRVRRTTARTARSTRSRVRRDTSRARRAERASA